MVATRSEGPGGGKKKASSPGPAQRTPYKAKPKPVTKDRVITKPYTEHMKNPPKPPVLVPLVPPPPPQYAAPAGVKVASTSVRKRKLKPKG